MIQKAGLRMLRSYKDQNVRSFVELCKEAGYPTDLGGYYLRQLVNSKYLEKGERGQYVLTPKGRQYITAEDRGHNTPRPHVLVVPTIGEDFIVLERLQQPFLHRKEWPATVIRAGETKDDAVRRLIDERLAKTVDLKYAGVFRRLDYYDNELFDDKLFFVHLAELQTEPTADVVNGRNIHIKATDLRGVTNKSRSLIDIYDFAERDIVYEEQRYDLSFEDFEPSVSGL